MVVLVVGGAGMLGHQLVRQAAPGRLHGSWPRCAAPGRPTSVLNSFLLPEATVFGVDVTRPERLSGVLDACRPQAVINCAGLVKQRREAADPVAAIELNALVSPSPGRLVPPGPGAGCCTSARTASFRAAPATTRTTRPMTPSTSTAAASPWVRSAGPGCLTLRTSIIGPELPGRHQGLLEWFLASAGTVPGYTKVVFSGLTTLAMRPSGGAVAHAPPAGFGGLQCLGRAHRQARPAGSCCGTL